MMREYGHNNWLWRCIIIMCVSRKRINVHIAILQRSKLFVIPIALEKLADNQRPWNGGQCQPTDTADALLFSLINTNRNAQVHLTADTRIHTGLQVHSPPYTTEHHAQYYTIRLCMCTWAPFVITTHWKQVYFHRLHDYMDNIKNSPELR